VPAFLWLSRTADNVRVLKQLIRLNTQR